LKMLPRKYATKKCPLNKEDFQSCLQKIAKIKLYKCTKNIFIHFFNLKFNRK